MNYRATLIKLLTFLGGIYFFLEFILPPQIGGVRIDQFNDQISTGFVVIGSMAFGLGLINILRIHGGKIVFQKRGWINSLALLLGLIVMMAVTLADWIGTRAISGEFDRLNLLADFAQKIRVDHETQTPGLPTLSFRTDKLISAGVAALGEVQSKLEVEYGAGDQTVLPELPAKVQTSAAAVRSAVAALMRAQTAEKLDLAVYNEFSERQRALALSWRELHTARYKDSLTKHWYSFLYEGLFNSLGSAMFALLGFYIATAAYRAFRVRSWESGLMMTAAVLVMLGQISFGFWLWSELPGIRLWLLSVPNTAAFRAINIGVSVAALVMAFRMWLSIESESFGRKK